MTKPSEQHPKPRAHTEDGNTIRITLEPGVRVDLASIIPVAAEGNTLESVGKAHGFARNPGETEKEYAARLLFEFDIAVENLWSVQDEIRTLRDALPATPHES